MNGLDRFVRLLMWACLLGGLALAAFVVYSGFHADRFKRPPEQWISQILPFVTGWLVPAISLWIWDGERPGRQSILFYVFALAALMLTGLAVLLLAALGTVNR